MGGTEFKWGGQAPLPPSLATAMHPITDTWVAKISNLLTNANIWELYWILNSQMTKTFRDNCNKNIVQQTSCDPLLPMFKCS